MVVSHLHETIFSTTSYNHRETKDVTPIIHAIARSLYRAGGLGLLTLGAFDSSPLVVPLGNDLLMLALSARHHERVLYYIVMATAGSLIGCFVTDWISRKSERGQKKLLSRKHLDSVRKLVKKHAAWALVVASVMPPPFPFTAFVAAAAAFRYPRSKLLGVVAAGRLTRFAIEGALAIHYGRWIVKQAQSPLLDHTIIALIVVSIAGSAFVIFERSEESKRTARQEA
jgi:membrane protein YqaA with SNARE-associated domain